MTEAERLAFLKRSLARARAQNAEVEILRQQQERDLAEAYVQRRHQQADERREERRRNLSHLKACAKVEPIPLMVEEDPKASSLLKQQPSLRQRLRLVLTPKVPDLTRPSSDRSLSPRKPAVPRTKRRPKQPAAEVPSAQDPQMPRKELLRATQHQLLKSCGLVIYKQDMKTWFFPTAPGCTWIKNSWWCQYVPVLGALQEDRGSSRSRPSSQCRAAEDCDGQFGKANSL